MIDRIISINGQKVKISQDLSFSHAGTIWDGALTLVSFWQKNKSVGRYLLEGKRVLQLGSGTGIVGLCAGSFNPSGLILTDLQDYLSILHTNIENNRPMLDKLGVIPSMRKLEWSNLEDEESVGHIDTIIGSELAYDAQNVLRLMDTIGRFRKRNPKLKVMISYQKHPQEWKNLESMFQKYFSGCFQLVKWDDLDADYRDQSIGILYIP